MARNRLRAAVATLWFHRGGVLLLGIGGLAFGPSCLCQTPDGGSIRSDEAKKTGRGAANILRPVGSGARSPAIGGFNGSSPAGNVPSGGIPGNFSGFSGGALGGNFGGGGFGGGGFGGGFAGGGFNGNQRFHFRISPKTPLTDLMPVAPVVPAIRSPWHVKELTQVPEVVFQKPWQIKPPSVTDSQAKTDADKEKVTMRIAEASQDGTTHVALTLAKIHHLNQRETDQFVQRLVETRADLAGLPFVVGDACRMSDAVSRQFVAEVAQVRQALASADKAKEAAGGGAKSAANPGRDLQSIAEAATVSKCSPGESVQAKIAAWMQMFATESAARRLEVVKHLAAIDHRESTRALAKLAVFCFEQDVREAALAALKQRPMSDCAEILLEGLRYPWPAIAEHAAGAIVQLERRDLAPRLVDFLDEPDPRAPVIEASQGRHRSVVRELVRLNHLHSCALCHAPAISDDQFIKTGRSDDFVSGAVPIPGQELRPRSAYYSNQSPDIFVRADVTYLRQDFARLQRVENAHPWPEWQRFDFLVRTREISATEAAEYREWLQKQSPDYRSPNHAAALNALRQLFGRDVEPTAAAWRRELTTAGARSQ
jgi:hypothetical protein